MKVKPDNYINVSANQVSPSKIKCGWIIEGESYQGQPCPQFEIADYIVKSVYREKEYHTIQLRELPQDERVKPEFIMGRLNA